MEFIFFPPWGKWEATQSILYRSMTQSKPSFWKVNEISGKTFVAKEETKGKDSN